MFYNIHLLSTINIYAKMTLINIQGTTPITDPFYRYKMNLVIVTQQKNRTAFENINQIAKDLDRQPQDILKFLKSHFASNFNMCNNFGLTAKIINNKQ